MPTLLTNGGPVIWLILFAAAIAARRVHRARAVLPPLANQFRRVPQRRAHRAQARQRRRGHFHLRRHARPRRALVKTAILNRDRGRDRVREAVEEAGLTEVPRLEEKLNLLATIAQIAPLLGLLGTILGFMEFSARLQEAGLYAHISGSFPTASGEALICAAAGIAVAIPAHAGYNYLVSRINKIVLDMERAAAEIVNIVTENGNGNLHEISAQRPAAAQPFDMAPFAAVFFCW
jgi:biopolymer transport protein ExbB